MGSIRFTIPISLYKFVFVCLILHIEAKDLVVNKAAKDDAILHRTPARSTSSP